MQKGEIMAIQPETSHPVLSHADGFAASVTDAMLLIGRILLGWLFIASAAGIGGKLWNIAGFAGYLRNLKVRLPSSSPGSAPSSNS